MTTAPRVTPDPTPLQREVLDFIRAFPAAHGGICPTTTDLSDRFSFSRQRAHAVVKRLMTKGAVVRDDKRRWWLRAV